MDREEKRQRRDGDGRKGWDGKGLIIVLDIKVLD